MTLPVAIYLIFVILVLLFLIAASVYLIYLNYSWLMGAPYVATEDNEIDKILGEITIHNNDIFIELGSGDGRVVRYASKKWKVKGIGIDINPILIWSGRIISRIQQLQSIQFTCENVLKSDISKADIIYIYLFPALVSKLRNTILTTTKRPVTIISHGFAIDYLKQFHLSTRQGNRFKTYYYKINK